MKHECNNKPKLSPAESDEFQQNAGEGSRSYGEAFTTIMFDKNLKLWYATNDEYSTPINYCPFCGEKLKNNEQ